ncbi:MAG: T9SS type A sorting domain-containing protein [Bacteroidia bacterium]|nr:T9SS type A sorting domain-containing protein [Bacteroidia bacterium]
MSYSFISETTDTQFYKIKLVLYRDVNSTTLFEDSIVLGVHKNDVLRSKVKGVKVFAVSKKNVSGTIPGSNCGVLSNLQLEQVQYEAIVGIPYRADSGYIVTWPRCCRSNGETNITDNSGMLSAVFISPGKFRNSSPEIMVNPFMFLCPGKVSEINYQVDDKDGDSLVYSLVRPYTGGNAVNPSPYSDELAVPEYLPAFVNITYNMGFSETKPFGSGGMAEINPLFPKSYLRSQNAGVYSVSVEVKEYRQGIFLGAARYDFIIAIPLTTCNNNVPVINLSMGDSLNLTFGAGKSNCYQMNITDTQDSIFLTSKGDILDGTGGFSGTRATLPDVYGFKSAQSQLCWIPPVSSVSSKPYLVEAIVKDNGCPSAIRYIKYFITVVDSGVTGVAGPEFWSEAQVSLFPNPVSNRLTIQFIESKNTETKFQVFNLYGEMVFELTGESDEAEFELNLSGLTTGVYFLQCERRNEIIYRKFIKQNNTTNR